METYTNPVHDEYFADPFVLRHGDAYYAYGTRPLGAHTIPALRSRDLVRWEPLGDVLEPLSGGAVEAYWAPEVAHAEGRFFMYYSAGRAEGEEHRLRVAVAEDPAGPFRDAGVVLDDNEPFTIDAHPFRDADGAWYLFYCRDFLDAERPGTGIVVRRLDGMTRLAGEPRVVVQPYADWNLFAEKRLWWDREWPRWYTIEGPFVRRRDGRYYCFFSGGAWREPSYGVGYATARHALGPWTVSDGEGPTLLRTVPGRVLGPGHASIVASPSGRDEYLVYHAWDAAGTARLMRIDRLEWTQDGPRSDGPSFDPRPVPV